MPEPIPTTRLGPGLIRSARRSGNLSLSGIRPRCVPTLRGRSAWVETAPCPFPVPLGCAERDTCPIPTTRQWYRADTLSPAKRLVFGVLGFVRLVQVLYRQTGTEGRYRAPYDYYY